MTNKPKTAKTQTPSKRVALVAHGEVKTSGTARLRVRKIRHSPAADPKLVKEFYAVAVDLRKKRLQKDHTPNTRVSEY